jgi:protein-S-isoprenylcysteine O-methyltransferase Ste14
MKATAFEFRFRLLIHAILYALGFIAPWNGLLHLDPPGRTTWLLLAMQPAQAHWLSFSNATVVLLVLAILLALAAAALRTWAAAYLGSSIVYDSQMHAGIVAGGPYRHLRNPLYLGVILHTFALALLMPPTGAIFCIVAIALFELRLIAVEQAFLSRTLGEPYLAYCAKVPSLLPSIAPRLPASGTAATWPLAFLGEIYFWGVVASFAIAGWRYNARLVLQGVIISLGVSLVVRAMIPKRTPTQES